MLRTLLIIASRKDGRVSGTYGAKISGSRMKFPFIISVVGVILCCNVVQANTRFFDHFNYLEYLNDFDRRNADLNDANIHTQWPFHSISHNGNGDEARNLEEKMFNQFRNKYRGALLEPEHKKPPFNAKLTQYTRYKPLDVETPEERFKDDVNAYPNKFEPEQQQEWSDENENEELVYAKVPRPVFPRIANVDRPMNFPTIDLTDTSDSYEVIGKNADDDLNFRVKPTFSTSYFPRIAPVDIPVNYEIEDVDQKSELDNNNNNNNNDDDDDEDMKQRQAERERDLIRAIMDRKAEPGDSSEFAYNPSDPRFYRDYDQSEKIIATSPQTNEWYRSEKSVIKMKKPETSGSDAQNHLQEDFNQDRFDSAGKDVEVVPFKPDTESDSTGVYIIAIVAGISAAATVGLIAVAIGWYNLQKHMKNAEDTDYPSYGIVGPNKDYEKKERDDAGDRRLAQSAQMYHYQHQKQQIIAMGRNPQGHGSQSDSEEEEDEEGNYTVYECPGLASIEGPLEVKNPMFDDDQLASPSQTPLKPTNANDTK